MYCCRSGHISSKCARAFPEAIWKNVKEKMEKMKTNSDKIIIGPKWHPTATDWLPIWFRLVINTVGLYVNVVTQFTSKC